jgi:hypothetical protein
MIDPGAPSVTCCIYLHPPSYPLNLVFGMLGVEVIPCLTMAQDRTQVLG